jgi:adenylate kinase family enzyme
MGKRGKRIVVVGVSASGKSTFARTLALRYDLPLIHMDTIWWKPGWIEVGEEEATNKIESITSNDEWIVEGYIPHAARPFVFERADQIIYLDYSGATAARRYIQRWWKHRKNPRPELEGSPEKFSFKFLKLVWSKREAKSLNESLRSISNQDKIIAFASPKQAMAFLQ